MTPTAATSSTSAVFGGRVWDLKYSHSALVVIHRAAGSLDKMAKQLLLQSRANGFLDVSDDLGAVLVWAGEAWRAPKLTLHKTKKRLAAMTDMDRKLLITWACADFLRAVLGVLSEQVAKMVPPTDEDDEGER